MSWHKRLTQAREAKNIKKSAFAKLVEVSPPTVTDWENGDTKMIEGANLVKVCSVLEIRAEWLINGKMPMFSVMLLNGEMKTIDEIHRINLAAACAEAGGVGRLAEKIGRSPSQVSQWLNGSLNSATGKPRGMGLASCRQVEVSLGKCVGWMDVDHSEQPAPLIWSSNSSLIERGPDRRQSDISTAPTTYIQRTNEKEIRLLEMYRLMDDEHQQLLIDSADALPKVGLELPVGLRNQG